MIISQSVIADLNPCKDRFDNYLNYYKGREFSLSEFLSLENITAQDKLWVCFRLLPKDKIPLVAADIADSVLHIYEDKYPNDDRPRKAIEAARSGDTASALAASNAAAALAASNAAAAARGACANAARAAFSAIYYDDAAFAATDATFAVGPNGKAEQEKLQLSIMLKYLEAS